MAEKSFCRSRALILAAWPLMNGLLIIVALCDTPLNRHSSDGASHLFRISKFLLLS